jgi:hypothetical protein
MTGTKPRGDDFITTPLRGILFSYGVNPDDDSIDTCIEEIVAIIRAHTPNLTDEDEEEITQRWVDSDDVSDSAIRTCSCGLRLEGFYAYQEHLVEVLS